MIKKTIFMCCTFLLSNIFASIDAMLLLKKAANPLITKNKTNIKILKIGGSAITDKSSPVGLIKEHVIEHITQEIANCDNPLIITHGSGSFGHPLYQQYNLEYEYNLRGTIQVHQAEKRLHEIIIHTMRKQGIPAISIDPMFTTICYDGNIVHMPIAYIIALLSQGFTPVIFGTMAPDIKKTMYGLSSDQITTYLAKQLGLSIVGFGSAEDGVYDSKGTVITEINPTNFEDFAQYIGGSEHTDVTGGMLGKVEQALGTKGLTSYIFNAEQEGNIFDFLEGEQIGTAIIS